MFLLNLFMFVFLAILPMYYQADISGSFNDYNKKNFHEIQGDYHQFQQQGEGQGQDYLAQGSHQFGHFGTHEFDHHEDIGDEKYSGSQIVDQTYEVIKPVSIPVYKHKTVPIPYAVPVPVPKPVVVPVAQPYPLQILVPHAIPVPVLKTIEFSVEKQIPHPIVKEVPFHYDKPVPVHVEVVKKYPVYVPVYKHIYLPKEQAKKPTKVTKYTKS